MIDDDQVVNRTLVDGRSIAWSSFGSGPPLLLGGWWSSHLGLDWRNAAFRRFILPLAEHRTVIRYDRAGTGLSDRSAAPDSRPEWEVETISAVLDSAGLGPADVMGVSFAAPAAIAFAAEYPHRVERLVVFAGYASGAALAPLEARTSIQTIVGAHWGIGSRMIADFFLPESNQSDRAAFAISQRRSMSARDACTLLSAAYAVDIRPTLSKLRSPTLLLHRRGDRAIPFVQGRALAARIGGSRFVPLDGLNHLPWHGETDEVMSALFEFGGVSRAGGSGGRIHSLTARERDVIRLIALGLTDQQIAGELVMSTHTAHRHVANVRRKLGVNSRAAAVAWAAQHGLV
ncbi:alpha/beta hydrolase family protein [Glaciihabitans tibetensis]|uniref:Alpha/beta hydrolase family protein n=1 Tax=Glaciihabitans tibetensis TaxID=1266600 RepID=A0A2T0VIQ0_9MICO|nr:alpha/beta fold hydrolase [Glaciihabitans tibetensis]PRY70110.1 alpha/beta hydrolase family protein [Glaciihabitans tibetensis]